MSEPTRAPDFMEEKLRVALRAAVRADKRYTGTDVTLDAAVFDALLESAADVAESVPIPADEENGA